MSRRPASASIRLLAAGLFLACPAAAMAGMPVIELKDVARARLEVISFFAVVYLGLTLLLKWLWNVLAKDWNWLPRISFGKSLAVMLVAGLLCYVVLTMISGARELMTPGAWKRDGLTYKLTSDDDGRLRIGRLRDSLFDFAGRNNGSFPDSTDDPRVPAELWIAGGNGTRKYRYLPGLRSDTPRQLLAEEPTEASAGLFSGNLKREAGDE
jgi:hypothetical protein